MPIWSWTEGQFRLFAAVLALLRRSLADFAIATIGFPFRCHSAEYRRNSPCDGLERSSRFVGAKKFRGRFVECRSFAGRSRNCMSNSLLQFITFHQSHLTSPRHSFEKCVHRAGITNAVRMFSQHALKRSARSANPILFRGCFVSRRHAHVSFTQVYATINLI